MNGSRHRIRHSGEGRNPERKGGTNHTQTLPTTRSHFHTLVCRHQPAWAIGTKIVIPCHRIRHSRGSGNPEGKGGIVIPTPAGDTNHYPPPTSAVRRSLPIQCDGATAQIGIPYTLPTKSTRRGPPLKIRRRGPTAQLQLSDGSRSGSPPASDIAIPSRLPDRRSPRRLDEQ